MNKIQTAVAADNQLQNFQAILTNHGIRMYANGESIYTFTKDLSGLIQLDDTSFSIKENENGVSLVVAGPNGQQFVPCLRQLDDEQLASSTWKVCLFTANEAFSAFVLGDESIIRTDKYDADTHGPFIRSINVKAGDTKLFAVPYDWQA